MPVYNDWESFTQLVAEIDRVACELPVQLWIVAVNDGSNIEMPDFCNAISPLQYVRSIDIMHLYTNIGHQRAIATGLVGLAKNPDFDAVIVMDSDGEDRPQDLPAIIAKFEASRNDIVVAQRGQRSEGLIFSLFYRLYQTLFQLLVGNPIDFGNFCLIPASSLNSLIYKPDIWNHLAATLIRANPPVRRVQTVRGKRYSGRSTMNVELLIMHGLSAVSVHLDKVLVRALLAFGSLLILAVLGVLIVVWIRLFTTLAIPGWATSSAGLLFVIILQLMVLTAGATFGILNRRATPTFIPALEAQKYIKSRETVLPYGID
jgi:hypothetical protein